jgi:hypothetical protein
MLTIIIISIFQIFAVHVASGLLPRGAQKPLFVDRKTDSRSGSGGRIRARGGACAVAGARSLRFQYLDESEH